MSLDNLDEIQSFLNENVDLNNLLELEEILLNLNESNLVEVAKKCAAFLSSMSVSFFISAVYRLCVFSITNKNQEIKKGDVLTRLQIQGEETIGIEKGQYGEVEVYHSHDKTIGGKDIEGNKSLDRQLETSDSKNPIEGTDQETQKLAQKYQDGYRSVEASYQEAKQHENTKEEPCEELQTEDLDGNPNTVSHSHTDDIVAKLMQNGEINDKFTEREIRERVERAWNNKQEDMSKEEFQKNMEEDIEQDAENMRGERGR